jgi:hypothetical protein
LEKTADGFGLKLKAGRHLAVEGVWLGGQRPLQVRFSFNRTFPRRVSNRAQGSSNYPLSGSWTRRLRPDYTLSIWPSAYLEDEAEKYELIVHLHFDAKYRVGSIVDLFGEDNDEALEEADQAEREGRTTRRADLLKMHAYKDAIRRSESAIVLYPGTDRVHWSQYLEVLPGLGAIPVIPGNATGLRLLSDFLDAAVREISARTTQRERRSFHVSAVHQGEAPILSQAPFPERDRSGLRATPPDEQIVLGGWCASSAEFQLLVSRERYFLGINAGDFLRWEFGVAKYVLLYTHDSMTTFRLLAVAGPGPQIVTGSQLVSAGLSATPLEGLFVLFELTEPASELQLWRLDPAALTNDGFVANPVQPRITTLAGLSRTTAADA